MEYVARRRSGRDDAVRVEAPARLHLGMLAVAGDGARRFGGLGVAVSRPAVVLEAEPGRRAVRRGRRRGARAGRSRGAAATRSGSTGGAHLRVLEAIPPHAGLGSGTKLALAVAQALAALHGRDARRAGARGGARAGRGALGGGHVDVRARRPRGRGRRARAARSAGAAAGAPRDAGASGARARRARTPSRGSRAPPRRQAFARLRAGGRAVGGDRAARAHVAAAGARRARPRGVRRAR